MRTFMAVGVAVGVLALAMAPGMALAGSVSSTTLTAGSGTAAVGQHIQVDVMMTLLNLGAVAGVDSVTLNFEARDAALQVGVFTPGALLGSGWGNMANYPPYPSDSWNYVNMFGSNITAPGKLGTLEVWANTQGTYSLAFDVSGSAVSTEVAGGGSTFALSTVSGTITAPEPATLALLGLGLALARGRRLFQRR